MYTNYLYCIQSISMDAVITTRIPFAAAKDLQLFIKEEHTDRSTLIRKMLLAALEEKKIEYALQKYKEGEITLGKAAELAKVILRKMLHLASDRGIPFQYALSDLQQDARAVP